MQFPKKTDLTFDTDLMGNNRAKYFKKVMWGTGYSRVDPDASTDSILRNCLYAFEFYSAGKTRRGEEK
jgi:hypothetical protein